VYQGSDVVAERRPVISFVVPCYNSAAYVEKCLDSLLVHPDDTEVLVIDDGSSDETADIARAYEERYPGIVRLVQQPNGGHGIAMQSGIREATGTYLKVVDSDDWIDRDALDVLVPQLREWQDHHEAPDLVVANYVYENQEVGPRLVEYTKVMPTGRIFGWDEVGHFKLGQYLLMHALIYRLDMLRRANIEFPRKTFYVDNLIAFLPLQEVRRLAYLNVDLYRYFVGRADQSVNEKVMITRLDQQFLVNTMLVDRFKPEDIDSPNLRKYLLHYLSIITSVSLMMADLAGTEEGRRLRTMLLRRMKDENPPTLRAFRWTPTGFFLLIPGPVGRFICRTGYKVVRKVFAFN